ncbi:MAG: hypothetical protein ACEQSH_00430 [Bacteroidia bacterium]
MSLKRPLTEPAGRDFAAARVINTIDGTKMEHADTASLRSSGSDFARQRISKNIGSTGRTSAALRAEKLNGPRSLLSWKASAASAYRAAIPTREFWILITSSRAKKMLRRTRESRLAVGLRCGRKSVGIFKFCAPIVTGSKLIAKHGKLTGSFVLLHNDIACRRIEAEYRQPRLFAEPGVKMVQGAML